MTRTKPRSRKRLLRKAFLTYLKFHRFRFGMTQGQLAKEIGISQGHYCDIEKGYTKPHPEIHKRIAQAIGRPPEEFTAMLYGVNPNDMVMQPATAGGGR